MLPRGVRRRLVLTIIGLVALTSIVLGVGAYAYVAGSLRAQALAAATDAANFNVAVLAAEALPEHPTRADVAGSSILDAFRLRGVSATLVDIGEGDPVVSGFLAPRVRDRLSPEIRAIVARGEVGWERLVVDDHPYLLVAARRPPTGPDFYFLFDAGEIEDAIERLGRALLAGGLILVGLAAIAGSAVAGGLLRPVRDAGRAAERIAGGDLSARLAVESNDELGRWAGSFNRMAAALEEKVGELEAAQGRERRFVADVSHELRTPLTALVNEAALLRDHLDVLPDGPRRAGQLLVTDVARLRALVDDLMEISRFDAAAEVVSQGEFELGGFLGAVAAARAPDARLSLPSEPVRLVADIRRLDRIVGNLLDNARVHGDARDVEVAAAVGRDRDGRDELRISIGDRGPGVDPGELDRLFDRFHKADPSRHRGGSGLGLAIAREHAALLGGSLTATLRPGGGLRFDIRVPVTRSLPGGDRPVIGEDESGGQMEPPPESLS